MQGSFDAWRKRCRGTQLAKRHLARAALKLRSIMCLAPARTNHKLLSMGKVQLLVVDDEPRVTEDLAHRLRELGYEVNTLDSPFGLLAELRTKQPDVVILDIHMPGLSGDSLLQKVRASPDYQHVTAPFVFVSGLSPERLESVSKNAGADAWLSKPVDVRRLAQIISQLTHTENPASQLAS
jgi:two-component system chemotaxis response regulator CheY